MDTRQNIQPLDQPAVLSIAFSSSRRRFITGLTDGLRTFRTDNCLPIYSPPLPPARGVAIADVLDDRYLAYVGGGKVPAGKPTVVIFWDAWLEREVIQHDFHEEVLGLRLHPRWMVVVLRERVVVFAYQEIGCAMPPSSSSERDHDDLEGIHLTYRRLKGPNEVCALYPTALNEHAVAHLQGDTLAIPAQATGQVQLITLDTGSSKTGSKRVLKAHNTAIRALVISNDGALLATASQQGTLIRVFDTRTLDPVGEYRRGVDHAITYSLDFSPGNRWLASTSDKGTVHIFDTRPPDPSELAATREKYQQQHRKTQSQSHASHRLSGNNFATATPESISSGISAGRSSPASATVQEYYGLRPVPPPTSIPGQQGAVSVMSAMKSSPFAPRIWKDVRSIASASFHLGNEPPHWQGAVAGKRNGKGYANTTAPSGKSTKVKLPILSLPNDPSGRPPKGITSFAAPAKRDGEVSTAATLHADDDVGATLYVLGGGSDPRWEVFELLPRQDGGWVLQRKGFRRFMERQFAD